MKRASPDGGRHTAVKPLRVAGKGRKHKLRAGSRRANTGSHADNDLMPADSMDYDDEELFDEYMLSMAPANVKVSMAALRRIEELREDHKLQLELDDYPDFGP